MDCGRSRTAISAVLDGEAPGVDTTDLDAHLQVCADCRDWREAAHELRRRARIAPVTAVIGPSTEALERIRREAAQPRARQVERLRVALLLIAVAQVAVTVPLILFGGRDLARDMGATSLGLAVGFLIAALRPGRAYAISPVVGTAAVLLMVIAVIELAAGRTHVLTETPHAVAFVGWLLVQRIGRLTPPTLENPERSLLSSLRRWLEGAAGDAYADFTDESRPAAGLAADEPLVAATPLAPAEHEVAARRGAA